MNIKYTKHISPISVKIPILYPLKIPKNKRSSGVFREYEIGQGIQEWTK